jgi:hypothetical protein
MALEPLEEEADASQSLILARSMSESAVEGGKDVERMQRLVNDKRKLALEVQTLKQVSLSSLYMSVRACTYMFVYAHIFIHTCAYIYTYSTPPT